MKIVSKINGLPLEATVSTSEVLKMGNGSIAKAVPDSKYADPLEDDEVKFSDEGDEPDEEPGDEGDNEPDEEPGDDKPSTTAAKSKTTTTKKTTTRKQPAKKTTAKKPATKNTTKKASDEEIEQTRKEAGKLGIKLTDNQIDGANEHDLDDEDDAGAKGEDEVVKL